MATSYALTFGALLLPAGRLGDVVGRRRLLVIGLVLFAACSLVCGVAQSPGMLVAARFLQGAGAAMVSPTVLSLLTSIYPDGPARSRALGIWTASLAAGGTAGIIAGGVLTQYLGWRSIFLVNLPAIGLLIPLVYAVLPNLGATTERRLDWLGASQITISVAALIFGLTNGEQNGFGAPLTLASLALSAATLAGFVITERRVAEPMVSFAFLNRPIRRTSAATMFLIGGLVAAYAYFIALFMQKVLGYSELETGLALVPSGLMVTAASMLLAHRLIVRFGVKPVLLASLLLLACGQAVFGRLGTGSEYLTDILPGLAMNAVGMGLGITCASVGITRNVGSEDHGIAAGLVPAAQQVGAAVVLAILATVAVAVADAQGSLVAGYQVGFLCAGGVAVIAGVLVATTSFREVDPAPDRLDPV